MKKRRDIAWWHLVAVALPACLDIDWVLRGALVMAMAGLVAEARSLWNSAGAHTSVQGLANRYGVSRSCMRHVLDGTNWRTANA